jgi:hypothetical protein
LIAVGILLIASLIPQLQEYEQPFAIGAVISSLRVFLEQVEYNHKSLTIVIRR